MPRLLPRLIERFEKSPPQSWSRFTSPRKRRKSLHNPNRPTPPSLNPEEYPKSILLTPNPITSAKLYEHHKALPPFIKRRGRVRKTPEKYDTALPMTEEERTWWCSPYLRMLSSPRRKCHATMQHLPKDFLIRFSKMRLPSEPPQGRPRDSIYLMPNGLQHSQFTVRSSGRGYYVLCDKAIINDLGSLAKAMPLIDNHMIHPLLGEQVGHLLRLRVLQELELLGDRLMPSRSSTGHWLLRRLTREEWKTIQETGIIAQSNALAVIVVPPLQKDPVTGKRPEPSMSPSPVADDESITSPRSNLPTSILYPTQAHGLTDTSLPQSKIPFYNGASLFPLKPQRAALHTQLLRLLGLQQTRKPKNSGSSLSGKASHAFLLAAGPNNMGSGDAAAVAVALWRLRMYEEGFSG